MKLLIDERLDEYVFAHTRAPDPLLEELRSETYERMQSPQMQVGRVEGALLRTLVALSGARRVLELGTFTGYSALSMAEAMPEGGQLITCDLDPKAVEVAKRFFARSPHGAKIEIRLGDALETIQRLPADEPFDLAFLDADKERYLAYYEAVLPLLRPGGLFVADNTLWSGTVVEPQRDTDRAICAFNDRVQSDPRVDNVLLSVRDGVMLARKL